MTSLQDIWDTPADTASSRSKSPSIHATEAEAPVASNPVARRPRNTLFLESGSEDEAPPTTSKAHYASKSGSSKPDIDAFWADLDDDADTGFQELAPSLDIAALKRQTEARLALTPHQILPSSSPPRDTGDDNDGTKEKKKKERDGQTQKKRAILNEGRILGPDGFPALIKQTKDFKPKGKGHELSDLNRLMNVYHFWSHHMYPNTHFSDTVQRVEKLCHSKRMHVALGVWRDEAKGLINGLEVPDANDADNSDDDDDAGGDGDGAPPSDIPVATEDERSSPAPSRRPSVPPSSASSGGLDDDFDIDAMIMEDEIAIAHAQVPSRPPAAPPSTSRPAVASTSTTVEDDAEMWDAVMGDFPDEPFVPQERQPSVAVRKPAVQPIEEDEDMDMWDIVNELEMEAETETKTKASDVPATGPSEDAAPQSTANGLVGVDPSRKATNDDGWDEMYT